MYGQNDCYVNCIEDPSLPFGKGGFQKSFLKGEFIMEYSDFKSYKASRGLMLVH